MLRLLLRLLKENDIHYRTGSVKPRFACLVAFAAGFWPGMALAQSKPADGKPPAEAPAGDDPYADDDENQVVITGTRSKEAAGKSVVRVDVVTREEAKRRGATNVGEALAGELGMQVNPAAYGSIGQPSAAQIGGFDRERVLVLQDGERAVGDVGGAVDLAQLSLGGVSRIEIVQGPSSALYGTSAIGGVINVISGPPEQEGWSGRFQVEGRNRWGGLAAGEVAYRADDNWVALESSFYGTTGVSLAPPDLALPDTYRVDVGLRAGTKLGKSNEVTAKLRYGREAGLGLDAQDVPGLGTFLIDVPDVTDRFSAHLRDKFELGKGHELTLTLGKQWFWNHTGNDRQDSELDEERQRFHTMHSGEAIGSFFQGEIVSFLVGARGEIESFHQDVEKAIFANGEVVNTSLQEVTPTTLGNGAAYAQVKFDPVEYFSATVGGRIEASPRYGFAAAPRAAIAVLPTDGLVFRLSGGRGYRVPTAKEIGFVFDHSSFGYRVIGNPDLDPETSWGFQVDGEWKATKALAFRASGYANWVDQLIDFRPAEESTGPAGVDDYTYVNVGKAFTGGAQASVRVKAHEYVRAEAGYAYIFSRDEVTQRPLPGRPPHTLLTSIFVETPIGLSFYGRARVVTDAYIDDETRTPPFGTLDLRVAQKVWPGAQAYAGVLNLLGVQKDPLRELDQRPIEGRTLYLGLAAELPPPTE
jgi:outer membrane receptor for ferrienterochelin and colicins